MHGATASQLLTRTVEHLSDDAQEQTSSWEEAAASLQQGTGTVQQRADNARQAMYCHQQSVARRQ
jgi:methyl-accepting chemotaxis protein